MLCTPIIPPIPIRYVSIVRSLSLNASRHLNHLLQYPATEQNPSLLVFNPVHLDLQTWRGFIAYCHDDTRHSAAATWNSDADHVLSRVSLRTYSQRFGFHSAYNEAHLRLQLVCRVFYDTLASIIFKALSIQTCKLSLARLKSIAEEPRVNSLVSEYNFGLSHVYDLENKDL